MCGFSTRFFINLTVLLTLKNLVNKSVELKENLLLVNNLYVGVSNFYVVELAGNHVH